MTLEAMSSHSFLSATAAANTDAEAAIIISPRHLAKLKSAASSLDLTGVHDTFIEEIKKRWGGVTVEDIDENEFDALDGLVQRLYNYRYEVDDGYSEFAKCVTIEYKKFLVIKSVELLAQKKVNTDRVIEDSDTFKEGKQVDRDIQDVDADDDDDDDDNNDDDDDDDAGADAGADDDNDENDGNINEDGGDDDANDTDKKPSMMPERTSEALSMASWMEKCQPGPLIDMFWHSHMLMPVKYENDCRALLVNEIIDYEPGYSPTKHSDSDVHSKDEDIFKFERIFQNHPLFGSQQENHVSCLFSKSFKFSEFVEAFQNVLNNQF